MGRAKGLLVMIAALLALSLPGGCGRASADKPQAVIGGISTGSDRVIATVNGEKVLENVFMEWSLPTMSMSGGFDYTASQGDETLELINMYKYTYLNSYIELVILLQEARARGIAAGEDAVEEYRQAIMRMYAGSDEETFKAIQKAWGFSDASMRRFLKNQLVIQLLYDQVTAEVTEPAQSPEDFYDENPDWFMQSELRLVRNILVGSLADAMLAITRFNSGADFGDLVNEMSVDAVSARNGGVVGPFDSYGAVVGGGALVEPFTKAAFGLEKVGDITQLPVVTDNGYHVIILDDIIPGRPLPFDEIEDDLTYDLLVDAKDEFFQQYLYALIDSSVIDTSY